MSKSRECGVQIWFWPRDSLDVPIEISNGEVFKGDPLYPNPIWGAPAADFPLDPNYCSYDHFFNAHQMVFDLTFCVSDFSRSRIFCSSTSEDISSLQGDWAGNTWASSGCGIDTCENCKHPSTSIHNSIYRTHQRPFRQLSTTTPPLSVRPIGKSIACAYIHAIFPLGTSGTVATS